MRVRAYNYVSLASSMPFSSGLIFIRGQRAIIRMCVFMIVLFTFYVFGGDGGGEGACFQQG